ncbi:MAG: hypothetical protein AAFQ68_23680 [Bacteroidota bacterium]
MSISIKTILKLICLLGLFACTSQPASAQDLKVDFDDLAGRSAQQGRVITHNNTTKSGGQSTIDAVWYFDGADYRLKITGLAETQVTSMSFVDPAGTIYSFAQLQIGNNLYQVSEIPGGYYSIVIQTNNTLITENIHLQH